MIVTSYDGVSPQGVLTTDPYIPIQLEFPPSLGGGGFFYCEYRSTENGVHQPSEGWGFPESMLEVVMDWGTGRLCRLVLVSVLLARYQDVDPGVVVVGDPVFDVESMVGDRFAERDRLRWLPSVDQYEQYEILIGDHRVTLLFDGRVRETAILVGDHLIVFIDRDREVCGFQFIGLTDAQMKEVIDSITFKGRPIVAQA